MKKEFDYSEYCLKQLFSKIPELQHAGEPYNSALRYFSEVNADAEIIYGAVLSPYFLSLLKSNKISDKEIINRISTLIEDLASHEAPYISWVLNGFIYDLVNALPYETELKKYLLPNSLKIAQEKLRDLRFREAVINRIFKQVPEFSRLSEPLKSDLDDYMRDKAGATIIYESVLCPYFLSLVNNPSADNEKTIEKIAALIEEMVLDKEFLVKNVAEIGFIEPVLARLKPTKDIEKYLLPHSLQSARLIGFESFGFNPKTWEKE